MRVAVRAFQDAICSGNRVQVGFVSTPNVLEGQKGERRAHNG